MLLLGGAVLLAEAVNAGERHRTTAGGYDLSWWTVDDGGGASSGDTYAMRGTAGQPDAGTMSGGTYKLGGGFWGGGEVAWQEDVSIYLPVVVKNK
ncbi:MAG: hypothetical protein JXM73_23465 [Anaerolineae bacterium]|nr:hypothetical protein [Anaerolineae bacterium]